MLEICTPMVTPLQDVFGALVRSVISDSNLLENSWGLIGLNDIEISTLLKLLYVNRSSCTEMTVFRDVNSSNHNLKKYYPIIRAHIEAD